MVAPLEGAFLKQGVTKSIEGCLETAHRLGKEWIYGAWSQSETTRGSNIASEVLSACSGFPIQLFLVLWVSKCVLCKSVKGWYQDSKGPPIFRRLSDD